MIVTVIVFFAILTQAASGFGLALVSMPLLVGVLGISIAAPLVNLIGVASEIVMLSRYRQAFSWKEVSWLVVPSLFAIPVGVGVVKWVNAEVVTAVLGAVLVIYAIYALLNFKLPLLENPRWAIGFGWLGGLLSGAFNTSGPPVVVYATCRRWPPQKFKGNLQAYFLLNSIVTMSTHALLGNYNHLVTQYFLWALPGMVLGYLIGFRLDRCFTPQRFKQLVMVLLVFLGIRLLL
ncbi:MAG: sulfite exporter TauE/SafE family protein [Candidatus Promineifilaceae bacterium]